MSVCRIADRGAGTVGTLMDEENAGIGDVKVNGQRQHGRKSETPSERPPHHEVGAHLAAMLGGDQIAGGKPQPQA